MTHTLTVPPKLYRSRPRHLKVGDRVRLDERLPNPLSPNYPGANRYGSVKRITRSGTVLLVALDSHQSAAVYRLDEKLTIL